MSLFADLKTLYHLTLKPVRGKDHAQRLESFYAPQAESYDGFRRRLLQGRRELIQSLPVSQQSVWVDLGGGTGANLEYLEERISFIRRAYIVDLSPSLLKVAQRRIDQHGWSHVQTIQANAITFRPPEGAADVVTFSYSLTMIPDWFAAIENAYAMLRPGGVIGVVDFYVSRKHPPNSHRRHGWLNRHFWPAWFGLDNVFLSPDHTPYLHGRFETLKFLEERSKAPYLPLVRMPYYIYIGRK